MIYYYYTLLLYIIILLLLYLYYCILGLQLTPVAPHSLTSRPIVLRDDVCLEIRIPESSRSKFDFKYLLLLLFLFF